MVVDGFSDAVPSLAGTEDEDEGGANGDSLLVSVAVVVVAVAVVAVNADVDFSGPSLFSPALVFVFISMFVVDK